MIVTQSKKFGWGHTQPSEKLIKFTDEVIKPNIECFNYFRQLPEEKEKKKAQKMYTYICPQCEEKIKVAKEDANIECVDCGCQFELKKKKNEE